MLDQRPEPLPAASKAPASHNQRICCVLMPVLCRGGGVSKEQPARRGPGGYQKHHTALACPGTCQVLLMQVAMARFASFESSALRGPQRRVRTHASPPAGARRVAGRENTPVFLASTRTNLEPGISRPLPLDIASRLPGVRGTLRVRDARRELGRRGRRSSS
jgi:hypothetical protein